MHDLNWKTISAPQVASAPSNAWHRSSFAESENDRSIPRPGHSLAVIPIQQSGAPRVQAKLKVSHPEDGAEREADQVADKVMTMSEPASTAAHSSEKEHISPALMRKCTECETPTTGDPVKTENAKEEEAQTKSDDEEAMRAPEGEEEEVQTKSDDEEAMRAPEGEEEETVQTKSEARGVPAVTPALESNIKGMHGGGAPLSKQSRNFFEPRFGADFRAVRIHTGSQASHAARALNAKAFTVGNSITFGEGNFSPDSNDGKRLLAHELTHVVQQRGRH